MKKVILNRAFAFFLAAMLLLMNVSSISANFNDGADVDAEKRRNAAQAFQTVGYWGDYASTKMTAEMAEEYIKAIEKTEGHDIKAILMDIAGDGIPLLLTISLHEFSDYIAVVNVFHWKDGKLSLYPMPEKRGEHVGYNFGYYNGTPAFQTNLPESGGLGDDVGYYVFKVSNGKISKIVEYDGIFDYRTENGEDRYYRYYKNGEEIDVEDYVDENTDPAWRQIYQITEYANWHYPAGQWTERDIMITALSNYIDAISGYQNFERVDGCMHYYADEAGETAWEAYKEKGGVVAIYEIVDRTIFYVILEIDGVRKGALVKGYLKNGKLKWKVAEKHDEPVEESVLDDIARTVTNKSNVTLDFEKIASFKKQKDFITYIKDALENMSGVTPNDVAKGELVSFIEAGISSICTNSVSGRGNRFTLNKKALKDMVDEAQDIKDAVNDILVEKEISLGKEINVIVRVLWKNCKDKKPCSITLDSELYKVLDDASVRLMLGKTGCFVQISAENAEVLSDAYPNMKIVFSKTDDATYAIQFETDKGKKIDKLPASVTFGIPADSLICTVMASYSGGSDNWGGQFDQNAKTLSFDTPYSGQYEVMENNVQIDDIGDLSEESQKAIRFLVSKGYLTLDENNFLPYGTLSRYQFTQALVGMFFALDRSETATFKDVPTDSPYYPYVASAQAKNIVEGYDSETFGGEINLTVEHMLALAGRTLVEEKAYAVPTAPGEYLDIFTDREKISDRTASHVALAIREGLFKGIETSESQKEITREQAAVILYRLFLLLYEVPPVDLDMPSNNILVILIAIIGGLVVLCGGALIYVLKSGKKKEKDITKGSETDESITSER